MFRIVVLASFVNLGHCGGRQKKIDLTDVKALNNNPLRQPRKQKDSLMRPWEATDRALAFTVNPSLFRILRYDEGIKVPYSAVLSGRNRVSGLSTDY